MRSAYLFEEQQRFTQPWILLTVIGGGILPVVVVGFGVYQQLMLGIPWGDHPMSTVGLVTLWGFLIVLMAGLAYLFLVARLDIKVDRWALQYRFKPFHQDWHRIERESITHCKAYRYSFRGYGIGTGFDGIKTYNVKGSMGVQVNIRGGHPILFGTQRAPELLRALETIKIED